MALNPDNFIFHSDFWYPTNYKSGYKNLGTGQVFLTDGYEPGDLYAGYVELQSSGTTYVYYRMFGDNFWTYTSGGNLYANKSQPGTGKIHYRLYKQPRSFSFISRGKLEKVLFEKSGTVNAATSSNPFDVDVPTNELFYCRGIWRYNGGPWYGMDSDSPNGIMFWNCIKTGATTKLQLTFPPMIFSGTVEYKVIGVKLND